MKFKYYSILLFLLIVSCKNQSKSTPNGPLKVVTTTTMLTDLVKEIGGEAITVQGLMGSGVDPHLYKASEGDVSKLFNADLVFYSGLHLEGKLVEIFEKMEARGATTVALTSSIDENQLIGSEYFASNYDPHVWFNLNFWKQMTVYATEELKKADPKNANLFQENSETYLKEIETLQVDLNKTIEELPTEKRVLVTAHDAFNYFGEAFGFEVVGLQGLSTATEAGVQDVQNLAKFIIERKVKAIFVESSVPKRTIEALEAAVLSKGHEVTIGGTLYSDALGTAGTVEGTYTGMFRYNVRTIVNALK